MVGLCGTLECDFNDERLRTQRGELKALLERLAAYMREDIESDTESSISDGSELEKSLDNTIRDLRSYIRCLTNLKVSLEHPAPAPVDKETENIDVAGFKVPEAAEYWCRMIMDKFKNIDIRLAERLEETNWLRYQRISRKLGDASDGELTDNDEVDEPKRDVLSFDESAISTVTKSTSTSSSIFDNQHKNQKSPANSTSALSSAIEYVFQDISKRSPKDNESQTISTSFNSVKLHPGHLHVPTLSSEALTKKPFPCTGDKLSNITNQLARK